MLDHKHLIIKAKVLNPPKNPKIIKEWMNKLVSDIDMKFLLGPYAVYSNMVGNRGLTCIAAVDMSSITFHSWDEDLPGVVQLDVYSCKTFDEQIVIRLLDDFKLLDYDCYLLDRNGDKIKKIKQSNYKRFNEQLNKLWSKIYG